MPHVVLGCFGCHVVWRKIVHGQFSAVIKFDIFICRALKTLCKSKIIDLMESGFSNCTLLINGLVLSCLLLSCLVRLIFGHDRSFLKWICVFLYREGCTYFFWFIKTLIIIQMENGPVEKNFHWVSPFFFFFFAATPVQIKHFTYVEVAVKCLSDVLFLQ